MDNKKLANWLLSETVESFKDFSLNEGFEDMKFPVKFHSNLAEYAKKIVTNTISKMSDGEYEKYVYTLETKKPYTQSVFLDASKKGKNELIEYACEQLEYASEMIKDNKPIVISNIKEFKQIIGNYFAIIGLTVDQELKLKAPIFTEMNVLSKVTNPKGLYSIIVSNPKIYGTLAPV